MYWCYDWKWSHSNRPKERLMTEHPDGITISPYINIKYTSLILRKRHRMKIDIASKDGTDCAICWNAVFCYAVEDVLPWQWKFGETKKLLYASWCQSLPTEQCKRWVWQCSHWCYTSLMDQSLTSAFSISIAAERS